MLPSNVVFLTSRPTCRNTDSEGVGGWTPGMAGATVLGRPSILCSGLYDPVKSADGLDGTGGTPVLIGEGPALPLLSMLLLRLGTR
jgi:hypothetical protein